MMQFDVNSFDTLNVTVDEYNGFCQSASSIAYFDFILMT